MLFLQTLRQLRVHVVPRSAVAEKLSSDAAYELTRSSGLLRQLFMDTGTPLIHLANRGRGLAITFPVLGPNDPPPIPRERLLMAWSPGLFDTNWERPGSHPRLQELKKDRFLRVVVLRHMTVDVTVKDIIQFEAHVSGGVHHGEPRGDVQKVLYSINEGNTIEGVPLAADALRGIITATLRGLWALETRVALDNGEPPPEPLPKVLMQSGQGRNLMEFLGGIGLSRPVDPLEGSQ